MLIICIFFCFFLTNVQANVEQFIYNPENDTFVYPLKNFNVIKSGPLQIAGIWNTIGNTTNVFGSLAKFNSPFGIAYSSNPKGFIISDYNNNCIRFVSYEYPFDVKTVAGICYSSNIGTNDGIGNISKFNNPMRISSYGDSYIVSDYNNHCIRYMVFTGSNVSLNVSRIIGICGSTGAFIDTGLAKLRFLQYPIGLTFVGKGNTILVIEGLTMRLIRVNPINVLGNGGNFYVINYVQNMKSLFSIPFNVTHDLLIVTPSLLSYVEIDKINDFLTNGSLTFQPLNCNSSSQATHIISIANGSVYQAYGTDTIEMLNCSKIKQKSFTHSNSSTLSSVSESLTLSGDSTLSESSTPSSISKSSTPSEDSTLSESSTLSSISESSTPSRNSTLSNGSESSTLSESSTPSSISESSTPSSISKSSTPSRDLTLSNGSKSPTLSSVSESSTLSNGSESSTPSGDLTLSESSTLSNVSDSKSSYSQTITLSKFLTPNKTSFLELDTPQISSSKLVLPTETIIILSVSSPTSLSRGRSINRLLKKVCKQDADEKFDITNSPTQIRFFPEDPASYMIGLFFGNIILVAGFSCLYTIFCFYITRGKNWIEKFYVIEIVIILIQSFVTPVISYGFIVMQYKDSNIVLKIIIMFLNLLLILTLVYVYIYAMSIKDDLLYYKLNKRDSCLEYILLERGEWHNSQFHMSHRIKKIIINGYGESYNFAKIEFGMIFLLALPDIFSSLSSNESSCDVYTVTLLLILIYYLTNLVYRRGLEPVLVFFGSFIASLLQIILCILKLLDQNLEIIMIISMALPLGCQIITFIYGFTRKKEENEDDIELEIYLK